MNKERFIDILKRLQEALEDENMRLNMPNHIIFENAVLIYNQEEVAVNIEKRQEQDKFKSTMASEKQLSYLERKGIKIPENLKKVEAHRIIEEIISNEKSNAP